MTEDAARPDPALVEAEVQRLLGDAYSADPRARFDAVVQPAAYYAALAQRLAEVKAEAVDELSPDGVDKAALARELGIKSRQRIGQLKDQAAKARERRAAEQASKES